MGGDLLKADIFFFVTTVAVVFISAGIVIALVYLIKILRDVTYLSKKVKEEGDRIIRDVSEMRENMKREGFISKSIKVLAKKVFGRKIKRSRTTHNGETTTEQ